MSFTKYIRLSVINYPVPFVAWADILTMTHRCIASRFEAKVSELLDKRRNEMALFQEQEILSENQHKQVQLRELGLNESIGFYFDNTETKNSQEYGDFSVCQGLEIDLSSQTVEELIRTATPISFIPNTLLSNKIDDKSMARGRCYRIEKRWERGQKFKDGSKAKGYGYALFYQDVGPQIEAQLATAYQDKISGEFDPHEKADESTDTQNPSTDNPAGV